MLMPSRVRADPVELERALQGVQELRKHVVEALLVGPARTASASSTRRQTL